MNATANTVKPQRIIRKVGIYRILIEPVVRLADSYSLADLASFVVRDHSGKFCLRAGTLQQCFNFINCKLQRG